MTSIPSLLPTVNVSAITGLPELPENYVWEVEFRNSYYDCPARVYVRINERKSRLTWPRKRKIEWTELVFGTYDEYNPTDSDLENSLIKSIRELAGQSYQKTLNKLVLEKLAGEYPPKSLPVEDK